MHIHILGICGTFMGGLAVLANQLGYKVTGSDNNVYPPMSTQLEKQGIVLYQGHNVDDLIQLKPDLIIIGNVMRRGMRVIEHILTNQLKYCSGPKFLSKFILQDKHVLAVSGTHGKTTTTAILTWILQYAGLKPGFLIGGVAENFAVSAELGDSKYFVVEADEYDSAFFDKRSKFIHYNPSTLIINNLEFDHADIFDDLLDIKKQFHNLIRTMPQNATIIYNKNDNNILDLLNMGCWSELKDFSIKNATWDIDKIGEIKWSLPGDHNLQNAIAAIAAASNVGVSIDKSLSALQEFKGVARRMEIILYYPDKNITIYDDFAHHPTAIQATIKALRDKITSNTRIIAVIDINSNTMAKGVHKCILGEAVSKADIVYFYNSKNVSWDIEGVLARTKKPGGVFIDSDKLAQEIFSKVKVNDHILLMGNGSFGGINSKLKKIFNVDTVIA